MRGPVQVLGPRVYKMAKETVVKNVTEEGTDLHKRVQDKKSFYDKVRHRMSGYLESQPKDEALKLHPK